MAISSSFLTLGLSLTPNTSSRVLSSFTVIPLALLNLVSLEGFAWFPPLRVVDMANSGFEIFRVWGAPL